ncbi:hypothetical protein LTR09_004941 [Extremus antarcticus]|uniref:DUF1446-domain-containing protein n=1 Tax=Extremus antarcticus TaxID=702011 RepID=A0AAJ0DHF9_9PEZI|nr:hypothetical protein LTR09_004941 [Extremus antarcticus]
MSPSVEAKSPVRIAQIAASNVDRHEIFSMLANAQPQEADVLCGDWMSEWNMCARGAGKAMNLEEFSYEETFVDAIAPALEALEKNGIKVAVNAGATDTKKLHERIVGLVEEKGLKLNVAYVDGDVVTDTVKKLMREGRAFKHYVDSVDYLKGGDEVIFAQCYLGAWGVARALREGADIVLCGRVADASPAVGAAAWWHGWQEDQHQELACALMAGHLIECTGYMTGANFTGFKRFPRNVKTGFPIAEISANGDVVLTKASFFEAEVSVETCTSQLMYEIQGPWYFNSDVTAEITNAKLESVGKNRVRLSGIKGMPPPPTTKVGFTVAGGYQAEMHWFLVGLDIKEKAEMLEAQIRERLDAVTGLDKFHCLKFTCYGSVAEDARNQASATVDFRVFAQAKDRQAISHKKFFRPCIDVLNITYPAATFHLDTRQSEPKVYYEYYVSLMEQSLVQQQIHINGQDIDIPGPTSTKTYASDQPTMDEAGPADLNSFGPTTLAPIGFIVHGRSGDKSSNVNIGLFVRHADEYDWLRSLLTTVKIVELLRDEYKGGRVDRYEFKNVLAVHFVLHDHMDRGVNSNSTYDWLGKAVAEFVRYQKVEIPNKFLDRGKI